MDDPAILASDAERERSLVSLRDAVVEGRLTLEEFSERVDRVHQARTGRELSILTVDLPARRGWRAPRRNLRSTTCSER